MLWTYVGRAEFYGVTERGFVAELAIFTAIMLALIYGSLVHQIARLGYLRRKRREAAGCIEGREAIYDRPAAPLAILIPSYREELPVLKQTLLSAALIEHPNRRVCVLIDDPPHGSAADRAALQAARSMVNWVNVQFEREAATYAAELAEFEISVMEGRYDGRAGARLGALYERAADWQEALDDGSVETGAAHVDRFFRDLVLLTPALRHRRRAEDLLQREALSVDEARHEYRRLASLFRAPLCSFERKKYVNLSHASNKAMNLNTYIALLGGAFRETPRADGLWLEPCAREEASLAPPAAEHLLTLDADSVLHPDYALKLVPLMEADARVAVAQTPYSAFPGAPRALERIAGATTDIQYVLHQGAMDHNAAYWVGANALLRYAALKDIECVSEERGHKVSVFIQDRTVIEDTGSTIDLVRKGWKLHNHMERLAHSATPPDFGSLSVQRQRWSNGGLVILPDLVRYAVARSGPRPTATELFLRLHYLVSPAMANGGLLLMLMVPFDPRLTTLWLPLTAVPYYICYGRDLRQNGYKLTELVNIYALNLLLLPVCVAGVFCSVWQILTGRKAAFARTPKIEKRTATPAAYILVHFWLMGTSSVSVFLHIQEGAWHLAFFCATTFAVLIYGFSRFIGWPEACTDLLLFAKGLRPRLPAPKPAIEAIPEGAGLALAPTAPSFRMPERRADLELS